ncbi:recombinase family protein, partial [uncultured Oscillibacter sp.]|uniref:recombinase family protein n=1 Tax=uncultured Oscillibacter sp. TaxID=876091 RepID=UPI002614F3B1
DGSSKMAKRKCYGYDINPDGELVVNPDEARVVCWIFEQCLAGNSLGKIAAGLERQGIPSPTGRPRWNREAIDKLLSNDCAIIGLNQQALMYQAVALIWFTYGSK